MHENAYTAMICITDYQGGKVFVGLAIDIEATDDRCISKPLIK